MTNKETTQAKALNYWICPRNWESQDWNFTLVGNLERFKYLGFLVGQMRSKPILQSICIYLLCTGLPVFTLPKKKKENHQTHLFRVLIQLVTSSHTSSNSSHSSRQYKYSSERIRTASSLFLWFLCKTPTLTTSYSLQSLDYSTGYDLKS